MKTMQALPFFTSCLNFDEGIVLAMSLSVVMSVAFNYKYNIIIVEL